MYWIVAVAVFLAFWLGYKVRESEEKEEIDIEWENMKIEMEEEQIAMRRKK